MKSVLVYREIGTGDIYGDIHINEVLTLKEAINEIEQNQGAFPESVSREAILENYLICFFPLTVSGKTYEQRKADLQDKAIMWSNAGSVANWSYGELATIQGFFEENGKRYGLLNEFRENAII